METRQVKLITGRPGGTAGKGSKTYKISLPSKWVKELGLDRTDIELSFDGNSITLKPRESLCEFIENKKRLGHKLRIVRMFDGDVLCSVICADDTDRTVKHEDHTQNRMKTPFGNNRYPNYGDFEDFLAERCIPESREGIREYLDAWNIDSFDPSAIIRKTGGVMAEDDIHLEWEE